MLFHRLYCIKNVLKSIGTCKLKHPTGHPWQNNSGHEPNQCESKGGTVDENNWMVKNLQDPPGPSNSTLHEVNAESV